MGGGTGEHRWWARVREMKESSTGRLHPTLVASGPESAAGATSQRPLLRMDAQCQAGCKAFSCRKMGHKTLDSVAHFLASALLQPAAGS